jgi:mono/diheme cytochrome c family protein
MREQRWWVGRLLLVGCLAAGRPAAAAEAVDYLKQVKPLLEARCYSCHGALKQKGKLRLDTASLAIKGGDSGPAVVAGDPAKSELLVRVQAKGGDRMPPEHEGEPLTGPQVELLRKWIAAGAPHPADEKPEADARDHWAFKPVARPPVPEPKAAEWAKNPIDAFVARRHEDRGLTPLPEASRAVLLRRLSLDLIGLPPTPEETAAFQADDRKDWYERAVTRLLDDPRHGERWARHWMDVWRYSDWWGLGSELRNSQKHMWRWRDWVVEAVNKDTAYDEMVRQMLAADELHPTDPDKLRATGFLARNYFLFNRHQWMDETVEHVGKAFLGLTTNCARCHDHKYDPIPQVDYYRLRAFFEPYHARLDVVPGEPDLERDGLPRVFDARPDEPTYRFVRGDEKNPDTSLTIAPGVPAFLAPKLSEIKPVELPVEAWQPQRRAWVVDNHVAAAKQRVTVAEAALAAAEKRLTEVKAITRDKPDPVKPPSPGVKPANDTKPLVADDFTKLDKDRWQLFGGDWKHSANRLEQKQDGAKRAALRLTANPPQDFDATVRFTLLGGSKWRSVGLGFDAADGDPTDDAVAAYHEQQVYVSGVAGGSKIHAAYNDGGKWQYPPAPAVRMLPVALNQEYTLRLQVRGTLINASLDGEPVLACATPLARRNGRLQVTTFDALVSLHEVRVEPLDPNAALRQPDAPSAAPPLSVDAAEAEQRVAKAAVAVAEAELTAVELRAKAWRLVWAERDESQRRAAHATAIKADREVAVARARQTVAAAERDSLRAVQGNPAAAKAVQTAKQSLDRATAAVAAEVKPADKLTEFVGAKWTPTRFLNSGADDPAPPFTPRSTGRRTALAKWVTDPGNTLTARVAVNHIWARHFGTPLVATVFDFGRKGQPPTHPELLDWLASELVESGWSMKHLHRLIVTSATYRLATAGPAAEANTIKDPDNVQLWRRTPVRLESQAVRDSLLSLADTLDPKVGGPSVLPAQQADSKRRSLYFFHSNNERNLFLTTFDEALVTDCYRREQSIVPQQALAMTNSRLVLDVSRPIADRVAKHLAASGRPADDEPFARAAFLLLLAAEPTAKELAACARAVDEWRKLPEAGSGAAATAFARANLVWVLLNHNDFVTVR